jgi:hypothetical protein
MGLAVDAAGYWPDESVGVVVGVPRSFLNIICNCSQDGCGDIESVRMRKKW